MEQGQGGTMLDRYVRYIGGVDHPEGQIWEVLEARLVGDLEPCELVKPKLRKEYEEIGSSSLWRRFVRWLTGRGDWWTVERVTGEIPRECQKIWEAQLEAAARRGQEELLGFLAWAVDQGAGDGPYKKMTLDQIQAKIKDGCTIRLNQEPMVVKVVDRLTEYGFVVYVGGSQANAPTGQKDIDLTVALGREPIDINKAIERLRKALDTYPEDKVKLVEDCLDECRRDGKPAEDTYVEVMGRILPVIFPAGSHERVNSLIKGLCEYVSSYGGNIADGAASFLMKYLDNQDEVVQKLSEVIIDIITQGDETDWLTKEELIRVKIAENYLEGDVLAVVKWICGCELTPSELFEVVGTLLFELGIVRDFKLSYASLDEGSLILPDYPQSHIPYVMEIVLKNEARISLDLRRGVDESGRICRYTRALAEGEEWEDPCISPAIANRFKLEVRDGVIALADGDGVMGERWKEDIVISPGGNIVCLLDIGVRNPTTLSILALVLRKAQETLDALREHKQPRHGIYYFAGPRLIGALTGEVPLSFLTIAPIKPPKRGEGLMIYTLDEQAAIHPDLWEEYLPIGVLVTLATVFRRWVRVETETALRPGTIDVLYVLSKIGHFYREGRCEHAPPELINFAQLCDQILTQMGANFDENAGIGDIMDWYYRADASTRMSIFSHDQVISLIEALNNVLVAYRALNIDWGRSLSEAERNFVRMWVEYDLEHIIPSIGKSLKEEMFWWYYAPMWLIPFIFGGLSGAAYHFRGGFGPETVFLLAMGIISYAAFRYIIRRNMGIVVESGGIGIRKVRRSRGGPLSFPKSVRVIYFEP